MRRRRDLWPLAALPLAFLLSVAALTWATRGGSVVLELDLTFSENACCSLTVWLNDTSDGPEAVLPIRSGTRRIYGLPVHAGRITHLRLDPGAVAGSTVVVHRATLRRGDRILGRLTRSDFGGFGLARATARPRHNGFEFRAAAPEPTIERDVSLATATSSPRLFLAKVKAEPLPYFVALIVLACLLLVPLAVASRADALFVLAIALVALAVRSLPGLSADWRFTSDVSEAVGYSAYIGVPKGREQLLLGLTAVVALGIPIAVAASARFVRRMAASHDHRSTAPSDETSPRALCRTPAARTARRGRTLLLPAAAICFLAIAFAPDLRQLLTDAQDRVYLPGFDANNLLFWDYLVQQGLVPIKDFFYPYGLRYLFTQEALWGALIAYLSHLAFWVYFVVGTFLSLARFSIGRALLHRFSVVTAIVVLAVLAGHIPASARYLGALGIVLLFAGVEPDAPPWSLRRILFMVAFAHVSLFELAQALYTLPSISLLLLLDVAPDLRRNWHRVLRRLVRNGLTLAIPVAVVATVLVLTGQLRGVVDFYAQLGALTNAWAVPTRIDRWLTHPDDLAGFIYWAVPMSLALGTYGVMTRRPAERLPHGIVLALGLVGLMLLQKQVIRPGIETAIWFPAVSGLVFWAAIGAEPGRIRHWATVYGMVGAIAALTTVSGGLERGAEHVARGPIRLATGLETIASRRDEFAIAEETRFVPARFAGFPEYRALVRDLLAERAVRNGGSVWTLGDDAVIVTILLGHRWPYYFNTFYDTSPIAWQRELIRQLEETPPAAVVWNRRATAFDGVPHVVRVPLIFEWAVERLAPDRTVGPFEILRVRPPGRPVDLDWWRAKLGHVVDLGHIPAAASGGAAPCSSGAACDSFVRVDFGEGTPMPPKVALPVSVGRSTFAIEFSTSPGVAQYVIPLKRVWFWSAAPRSAARAVALDAVPNARISVVRRTGPAGVLY